jgi:AcrR family transcriptional regulator
MVIHKSRVPRTKQISDEVVIDAALEIIHDRGPLEFTLADVGKAVGLASATLLQRFGSKEKLLEHAIARSNERIRRQLGAPLVADGDPARSLLEWLVELGQPFRTRALLAAHLPVLAQELLDARLRRQGSLHGELVRRRIEAHLVQVLPRAAPARKKRLSAIIEAHWHGLVLQWALGGRGSLAAWMRKGLRELFHELGYGERTR